METVYRSNRNIVFACRYHVVWCPKYRRKVLVSDVAERLKTLIMEVCNKLDIVIIGIEIMPDHVHLFIDFDPRLLLHKIIKDFKGQSASILRKELPSLKSRLPSLWIRSYFSSSIGHIDEETIQKYIENQKNV